MSSDPLDQIEQIITALMNDYRIGPGLQELARRCLLHVLEVDGELTLSAVHLLERLIQLQVELEALVQQADYLRKRFARLLDQKEQRVHQFTKTVQELLERYPDLLGETTAEGLKGPSTQPFQALNELAERASLEEVVTPQAGTGLALSELLIAVTEYGGPGEATQSLTVILSAQSDYGVADHLDFVEPRELRQAVIYRVDLAGRRVRVHRSPSLTLKQNEYGVYYMICSSTVCALPYGNRELFWAKPLPRTAFDKILAVPLDDPQLVRLRLLELLDQFGLSAESPAYRKRAASQVFELTGAMSALEFCPALT